MRSYLSKRKIKSHQYPFFRCSIPKDLQENFGGITDFRLSLGCVRNEDTQILCLKLKQITESVFVEIRSGMKNLSLDDINEILRIEVRKQIKYTQHYAFGTNVFDNVKKSQSMQNVASQETRLQQELSGENIKEYEKELDEKLAGILSSLGIETNTKDTNYKKLRRTFIKLYLLRFDWIRTLINSTENIDENDFRMEVDTKLGMGLFPQLLTIQQPPVIENYVPEPTQPYQVSPPLNSLQSTEISKCIDLFIGEKKQSASGFENIRERTESEIRTSLNLLVESFGDEPIGIITKEHSNKIKTQIKNLPRNRTKNPKYREKEIQDFEKMKIPQKDLLHTTTVNKHLGHLSSFMFWCVNNGYSDRNPFTGMKIKQKKSARDERNRFTEQELKEIFTKRNYLEYTKPSKDRYCWYWTPLIAITTGLRANEICALYLDNIREISGNQRTKRWCFDIVEEINRPDKRLKNNASRRIIPIHDIILDLGFIDFLNLIKKEPERKRLFEELTYSEGTYAKSISRFWNNRYLPLLGLKNPKTGLHSLRHTVIDHLKQKGVEPHFINELVGHSQGNISLDRYGKGYNPDILYNKCVKRIMYETSQKRSIDFKSLKVDWEKIIG
ncbi:MAG: site-specific integrase [SAR324 cluster bacterium]|nr:site-specific integrase [SAR324 cluster bacterium]